MHEILRHLRPGERVLDLGSQHGSFPIQACASGVVVVRVDLDKAQPVTPDGSVFVQADAARLPFRAGAFDAVISNHSLEHMLDLEGVLAEIGRVLHAASALYVAVPDASTWSDRIYRFIGKGGGHVNGFVSSHALATRIEAVTGLELRAIRLLHTGWSILRRRSSPAPRRLLLFGGGHPAVVRAISRFARIADRRLGTRVSVYGWALWFGALREEVDKTPRPVVCSNCGAGLIGEVAKCPYCGDAIV